MRHGQATSNAKEIVSCWPEKFHNPLTSHGKKQVKETAEKLKEKNIHAIFCSPVLRTRQSAEIVGKKIKIKPEVDNRLQEQKTGIFNGGSLMHMVAFFGERRLERFKLKPKGGETYIDIEKRMIACLKSIDKKYRNKSILIVSHELPLLLLDCKVKGISHKEFYLKREKINTAGLRKLN